MATKKHSEKNPKGEVTTFTYDKMGRLALTTDPAGHVSQRIY
jgi:YD repeat-containing protein